MLEFLCPDLYVSALPRVSLDKLQRKGLRGIILDIDNTVMEWGSTLVKDATRSWLEDAKRRGFAICFLSNNFKGRIEQVSSELGIPAAPSGIKPTRRAFRRALALLGTSNGETCVIGDQIFTDILGGKLLGLYTVLVKPLTKREFITTRIVRLFEKLVLAILKARGLRLDPD